MRVKRALACCTTVVALAAAGGLQAAEQALWLRHPAISPDGATIAFSYHGDVWKVPATGGTAVGAVQLLRKIGADVVSACFVIDLPDLGGRTKLEALGVEVRTLVEFSGH